MKKLVAPLALALLASAAPSLAQDPAPAAAAAPAPVAEPAAPAATAAPAHNTAALPSPAGAMIDRTLAGLNLTPEQQKQATDLRAAFEASTEGVRASLRANFSTVRKLRADPKTDPALLEAKHAETTELQAKLRVELDKLVTQIEAILDPAQREEFTKVRAAIAAGAAGRQQQPKPVTAPPPAGSGASHG